MDRLAFVEIHRRADLNRFDDFFHCHMSSCIPCILTIHILVMFLRKSRSSFRQSSAVEASRFHLFARDCFSSSMLFRYYLLCGVLRLLEPSLSTWEAMRHVKIAHANCPSPEPVCKIAFFRSGRHHPRSFLCLRDRFKFFSIHFD